MPGIVVQRPKPMIGPPKPVTLYSDTEKITEMLWKSLDYMPADVASQIANLFSPASLAIMSATLIGWAVSHFFGVGEIFDCILIGVGFVVLGFSAVKLAELLYGSVKTAYKATTAEEIDAAAKMFAEAVVLAGVTIITALLLRKAVKDVKIRPATKINPGLKQADGTPWAGQPPANLDIKYTNKLKPGTGWTDWYGKIRLSPNGTAVEQNLAYWHEMFHSYLRPKFGPLRELRAGFASSAYNRSRLLKYIEEALAETYAQVKVHGFKMESFKIGYEFPVAQNYVVVSEVAAEANAVGAISAGGHLFHVYVLNSDQKSPACVADRPEDMVCKIGDKAEVQ